MDETRLETHAVARSRWSMSANLTALPTFDSPEAEAAVVDVNEFIAIQDLIVTRETVILDSESRAWPPSEPIRRRAGNT